MFYAQSQDMVKALLDFGADINAKDSGFNRTLLLWSVAFKKANIVKALFQSSAVDLEAKVFKIANLFSNQ